MKKTGDFIAIVAFSVSALLAFRFIPNFGGETQISSIAQYLVMALCFAYFIHAYTLPTLRYLQWPEISFVSIFTFVTGAIYLFFHIYADRSADPTLFQYVEGVAYIFAIGLGEELVSRGFIYGVFWKYGKWVAVIGSSLTFGLMHLNLYLGADWDPHHALFHVTSATGFGVLACAVMLGTRSIWPAIVLHAFSDWGVVYERAEAAVEETKGASDPISLWETLTHCFTLLSYTLPFAFSIFFIIWADRRFKSSVRIKRLFIRLKLVESD